MAFITVSQQMLSDIFTNWLSANTNCYALLTNSSTYTFQSNMLAVVQQEVVNQYGYARVAFSPGAGSYNSGKTRFEFPASTVSVTATGGSIQFDSIYFIGGGRSYSNVAVSNINTGSNRLEFAAAHPFSNGDKVTVTADGGGTVPAALLSSGNPTTLFVVGSSNSNPYYIQLAATSGGSAITFTGGANTIRVRSVDGVPGFYATIGSTTIAAGQTYNFSTQFITGGSGVNVQS